MRVLALTTSQELAEYIRAVAPEYGLDPELCVKQCMAESSLRLNVPDSPTGAMGVMQLEPIALTDLRQRWGLIVDPHDPRQAVRGGLTLMRWLKSHYHGDMRKAYAAYNWGAGDVDTAIRLWGGAWESRLPVETRNYIYKICGPLPYAAMELPKAA